MLETWFAWVCDGIGHVIADSSTFFPIRCASHRHDPSLVLFLVWDAHRGPILHVRVRWWTSMRLQHAYTTHGDAGPWEWMTWGVCHIARESCMVRHAERNRVYVSDWCLLLFLMFLSLDGLYVHIHICPVLLMGSNSLNNTFPWHPFHSHTGYGMIMYSGTWRH